MNGQPSPEYCTDGKVVVGKNDADLSKHEFGWYAECCFWDGDKCNTDWDKIDCSTSEPPAGPNGAHLGYGCDGARYQGGGFSKEYCTNTDKSTGEDWRGAHNRYPWLQKCCYWDRSDNTCKNNPGEPNMKVTSKIVAETKAYDCHIGNPSANGVSGNKKWDAGCSGAVFMSGQPSPEYCTDGKVVVGKNDAELSKHEFGWYAECCFWDGDECNTDWDKIDCSTSEPPAGPNGAHLGYGCDGARYQGGGFSKEYCTNTDKSTGEDWRGAHNRYPWLQKCCYWDRSDNTCKNNP